MSKFTFHVIDNKTNKEANTRIIAETERWAKDLMSMDLEGWAIEEDGTLILLDECGKYAYAPLDRFTVVISSI